MIDIDKKNDNDEEPSEGINKIFEGQGPYSEDFSVNALSQPSGSAVWKPGFVDEAVTRDVTEGALRVKDSDLFCKSFINM